MNEISLGRQLACFEFEINQGISCRHVMPAMLKAETLFYSPQKETAARRE
jgi:hypothetical protein